MATGINLTGRRAQATRAQPKTDVQIGLPRPTEVATVQYFVQLPRNVWFFWVSRQRSIILAKKVETFSGRFWEIPKNALNLSYRKLLDHKNTSVFFQAVSGMSSWSFSYRWTQYQWEKTATKHQFIALLAREERNNDVFRQFFRLSAHFRPHSSAIFHPSTPQFFLFSVISIW